MSQYNNQKRISDKAWMESVMSQMGFKTKRIDEQQPAPAAAQQQQPTQTQQPPAPAAPPSKTMKDFFTTINNMATILGGKTAVPVDQKQAQAFNTNLEILGKLFPVFQTEMKKSQQAQAQQPKQAQQQPQAQQPAAAAQQPQQAQVQQPQR